MDAEGCDCFVIFMFVCAYMYDVHVRACVCSRVCASMCVYEAACICYLHSGQWWLYICGVSHFTVCSPCSGCVPFMGYNGHDMHIVVMICI